jgi:ATP-dependent DNA helicase DinG
VTDRSSTVGVAEALDAVTAGLEEAEDRPGQRAMATAVAHAMAAHRHLVVAAGTGTGKSLAYLVPAMLSGRPVVVATATKALQDQLATKDAPLVAAGLSDRGPLTVAVLKGRANYLCRQRAREVGGAVAEPTLSSVALSAPTGGAFDGASAPDELEGAADPVELGRFGSQVRRLIEWGEHSGTGDRAELDFEPHPRAWAAVSVTARECPGAYRCPSGTVCFAERARERAAAADVVVVNTHLYAAHVASDGGVLPDHDVVVLDEAHAVEDIMTAALGVDITAGRLRAAAQSTRGLLPKDDTAVADAVVDAADRIERALVPLAGRRVLPSTRGGDDATVTRRGAAAPPLAQEAELAAVLDLARGRLDAMTAALRRADDAGVEPRRLDQGADSGGGDTGARRGRALLAVGHLVDDLTRVATLDDDHVAWVESGGPASRALTLRAAPVEVGPLLARRLWPDVTAVLTSATVPPDIEARLGLPPSDTDRLEVESPFPFDTCALLYCAAHLPDPRRAGAAEALHDELAALITAAGGRTLALFTSWRAMHGAADALRSRLPFPILAQGDMPKARLLEAFSAEHAACLFATMSFWQGVDVPGPTLSLVTLDRLPFPRPDDPLLGARRDRAGSAAFRVVDLPRAATLLAQGAGRLIRSAQDRGVVAVLDSRLATAGYRSALLGCLPPMRRTIDHDEVVEFLEAEADRHRHAP